MTIAAGILHTQGLLLFADTELTAGELKFHASKNARVDCPYGRVGMVCAGHFYNAEATMQKIARALHELSPDQHPLETIERVLDREYRRIVWKNPDRQYGGLEFWIVFAIQKAGGRAELYVSNANTIRSGNSYECVGSGEVTARQMIHAGSSAMVSAESSAILAAYVMSACKRHVSGVSGMSLMMDFWHDGRLTEFPNEAYLTDLEDYFGVYHMKTWNLALAMMSPTMSDDDFFHHLEGFGRDIVSHRGDWASTRERHEKHRQAYLSITGPKAPPPPKPPTHEK